jgi:hypothetical protein
MVYLQRLEIFFTDFLRRERDSNPRTFRVNGFQDRRIRPLCHLSGCKIIVWLVIFQKNIHSAANCVNMYFLNLVIIDIPLNNINALHLLFSIIIQGLAFIV